MAVGVGVAVGKLLFVAGVAQGTQFCFVVVQYKPRAGHFLGQLAMQFGVAELGHGTAFGADNQNVMPIAGRVHAGGPGIDGIEPMDKAFSNKEVKRSVNCRRCGPWLYFTDFVEQFVGFHATLALQQDFKHLAPDRRQTPPALGT